MWCSSQFRARLKPPQPARPISTYVDPADRVAAVSNKAQADSIKTWSISEVDAKGKKKKGTLGIGNGAMFFASESDKNPVRKWQTSDIQSVKLEKSKHVHIEVGGADAASLHYHAGSKDTAEEILAKLESSRAIANGGVPATNGTASPPPAEEPPIERPRSSAQKSVHFAQDEPEEIPAEPYEEEHEEEPPYNAPEEDHAASSDGAGAVALYDFTADGEDELSVHEGEGLVVLERDSEEWWKVRNARGEEGVVPASYVEVSASVKPIITAAQGRLLACRWRSRCPVCSACSVCSCTRSRRGCRCRCRAEGGSGSCCTRGGGGKGAPNIGGTRTC